MFGWRQGGWSGSSSPRAAQEAAVQQPGLLQGVPGVSQGAGAGAQGTQMHGRGHPASTGGVRGGHASPAVQGQDVLPVGPSYMWQAEHAAAMCRALQGHVAPLPRALAARSSSNRPAASLALPHSVSWAWCSVVAALDPQSSALRLYDRGEGTSLTVRPADLEALHLGALTGDGGAALYLQGTVTGAAATRLRRQSGGAALCLVMAENVGTWLLAFSTSRWKVEGDREKFADAWRRWVEEQFPVGGMLHLRHPQACRRFGLRHLRPLRRSRPQRQRPSSHPRGAPHLTMVPMPTVRTCCSSSAATWPRSSVGRRRSTSAPGLGWMGLVTARGKPGSTAGPPTSTPRTRWTTSSGTMRLIWRNGTRRWPCWLALCRGARQGRSRRPRRGPERSCCPRVPALRRSKERRSRRRNLEQLGLQHGAEWGLLRGVQQQVRPADRQRGCLPHLPGPSWQRPPRAGAHGDRDHLASHPHRARVVHLGLLVAPLRPVIQIRRGALVRTCSREGAPPPTPERRCPGTSRARCGGTAYQWPRVCSTVRRWRRAS